MAAKLQMIGAPGATGATPVPAEDDEEFDRLLAASSAGRPSPGEPPPAPESVRARVLQRVTAQLDADGASEPLRMHVVDRSERGDEQAAMSITTPEAAVLRDFFDRASGLTQRQRRILEVIREAVEKLGYPPSVREIGQAVGLTSISSVAHQLTTLERKGYIRRDPNRPRAVVVGQPESLPTPAPLRSPGDDADRFKPGRPDFAVPAELLIPPSGALVGADFVGWASVLRAEALTGLTPARATPALLLGVSCADAVDMVDDAIALDDLSGESPARPAAAAAVAFRAGADLASGDSAFRRMFADAVSAVTGSCLLVVEWLLEATVLVVSWLEAGQRALTSRFRLDTRERWTDLGDWTCYDRMVMSVCFINPAWRDVDFLRGSDGPDGRTGIQWEVRLLFTPPTDRPLPRLNFRSLPTAADRRGADRLDGMQIRWDRGGEEGLLVPTDLVAAYSRLEQLSNLVHLRAHHRLWVMDRHDEPPSPVARQSARGPMLIRPPAVHRSPRMLPNGRVVVSLPEPHCP